MDASGHTNSHFSPMKASNPLFSPDSEESANSNHINGNHANDNHVNSNHINSNYSNGSNASGPQSTTADCNRPSLIPIAICGMACRLPGGIDCPEALWDFLISKGDARSRVPETRYKVSAYHSDTNKPGMTISEYGYFLDSSVDLEALDTSFFSMPKSEVERLDPQQKLLLEVSREALDDAGEVMWRGENIGVYVGSFGQDWYDMSVQDPQKYGMYQVTVNNEFMLSNRLSYEMDLQGPSMTIRTGCSAALVGLNEACLAISRGDCKSAIVGGTNILLTPGFTTTMSEQGVLSKDGSCKTFSANVDGYARGEAIVSIYVKPLSDALRDGNPVRAVVVGSAVNHDGKTPGITAPRVETQEALIRRAYQVAGIADVSKTGFVECHGTGTKLGDLIETTAIGRVFGKTGVQIGSVKPNLGHSEGASGLTSLLKAVLALEHRTIPPNIKSLPLNPKIPWEKTRLTVPNEPTSWPEDRHERVSLNSFGIGGTNAHIVIDSAASFAAGKKKEAEDPLKRFSVVPDTPQLLVLSANTPTSLQSMIEQYNDLIDKASNSLNLSDIAYTLANKREHLPYRSFMVSTKDNPGTASPPSASGKAGSPPSIVMVFTGQGAQWPQMGRELLRTNKIFRDSIRSLDKSLQTLMPCWKIEEELLRPSSKSRINEAEFSQPLCTALQIALVNMLRAAGVEADAVVGHSSGEIAAAYAAGALTATEAIVIAFLRGSVTKKQTRTGAMAAVGLSWEEADKYLVPGVVVACDNSPNNVTLSGDAQELEKVVSAIKSSQPSVLATILKVEKAYHSHHMVEIGEEYNQAMVGAHVMARMPSTPFFSSVTGSLLQSSKENENPLGSRYWQKNLESPVLFKSAVRGILKDPNISNPVFLELGPHPALAGPIRQILSEESINAPHVPSLTRRQNSIEKFLSTVGKLWALHVSINFNTLMAEGSCVSDLPRYPWNHQRGYWYETRVAKEWRLREHPYHDLLGVKVAETTDLQPIWRNLFHLDNAPWVRDHKINGEVVFPFAGYVAIAAEAVRQVTGIQASVSLRRVAVSTALVIHEGSPTELVTTFRRERLTESLDSLWWEFTISSHNGHAWLKHCSGEVRADEKAPAEITKQPKSLSRKLDANKWYDMVHRGGLEYGPHFTSLENITTSTTSERLAIAEMRNKWHRDETNYHLHPIVLDSYLQLLGCAATFGLGHDYRAALPTKVGSLTMFRCSSDNLTVSAAAKLIGDGVLGHGSCIADSKIVLEISDVGMSFIDSPNQKSESSIPITARSEWVRHIDFENVHSLILPSLDHNSYITTLLQNELVEMALLSSQRSAAAIEPQIPDMAKYKTWLLAQTTSVSKSTDEATITSRMNSILESLANTAAASVASAIFAVRNNTEAVLSGKKTSMELLMTDSSFNKCRDFLQAYDGSGFFKCLAQSKPNLRVLELSAASGRATVDILKALTRFDGQALYSEYIFTDVSSGIINSAKERFNGTPNLKFATLDLSRDPAAQGFQDTKFDLIIANGTMHATPKINEILRNARKMLGPNGRLLLQEPRPDITWVKYVFGILPGWYVGAKDGRPDGPYISPKRWKEELEAAGFQLDESAVLDSPELFRTNVILVAKPRKEPTRSKKICLLDNSSTEPGPLLKQLELRGLEVSRCTINDGTPPGQDVIVVLDEETPVFEDMDSAFFEQLKIFIEKLDGSGVFWITRPSQMDCRDPRYAYVLGLARTIRTELGVDFATCEIDDFNSSINDIVNVFGKFHLREKDGVLDPDFEYIIHRGATYVNRFFPFFIDSEMASSAACDEVLLTTESPGRVETLKWIGRPITQPELDQVEVETYSVGVNSKDVLVATGVIKLPELTFGCEGAGIVRRIGPNVKKFCVGDRVLFYGRNTLSSFVMDTEMLFEKMSDDMTFTEAASMPMTFVTAIYSLINVGRLEKGQSVLIHSGCSDVGLAAIQIACMIGADIYTTVGSEESVAYLMENFKIPRNRIFDSESISFIDGLLLETQGKGVDLVLNSLSGELLHATWRCVAKWGTMVEIGKRDLLGGGKLDMDIFLANRSYCYVDVDQMRDEKPKILERILGEMMAYFHQGHLRPVRVDKVFTAGEARDSFKYMQQASYIGKIVVDIRDTKGSLQLGDAKITMKDPTRFISSASYLLIGGLGGLGRSISIYMVQHGARNLTFLSPNAGSRERDQDFVREIESMGCNVKLIRGTVTNPVDVARAVDGTPTPLKGIIQMSMVLHDKAFTQMTIKDWNSTTEPKTRGTWNLHNATLSNALDLDFFVLFSSLSGIIGQVGQANYAAANTFLDAFVQYRTNMGLPCTAIDIGAVEGAGFLYGNEDLLKKMKGTGWRPIREAQLFEGLAVATQAHHKLKLGSSNFVDQHNFLLGIAPAVPLSDPAASARLREDIRMAIYHNKSSARNDSITSSDSLSSFLIKAKNEPSIFKSPETAALVAYEIGKHLSSLLQKSDEEVNISMTLSDLGMDSMVAIEMRAWWRQVFGFDISTLDMLAMGTLEALGKRATERLFALNDG